MRRTYPADARVADFVLPDGWRLRSFDWSNPAARGSLLWLGGRGDIFEKYLECFAEWHEGGWTVGSFDWRGQGGSGRLLADPLIGHIDDFATWVDDLAAFWADWTVRTPPPHVVVGHSMGAHLALRALVEARIAPKAAVLSAPMLGFETLRVPAPIAEFGVRVLAKLRGTTRAWPENERPGADAPRELYLTHDRKRYADELWWKDEQPELRLGAPSWSWLAAAVASNRRLEARGVLERLTLPILIVATEGDRLVSPAAIRAAAARLPDVELTMCSATVAHEVLREVDAIRAPLMATISDFLTRKALST